MTAPAELKFIADPAAWQPPGGMVVHIPPRLRSKEKLLAILAQRLKFPPWAGRNWDALEELLRDLSWLPHGPVTLIHSDLPFGPGGEHRSTYLAILGEACRYWAADKSREFIAVFPATAETEGNDAGKLNRWNQR